MSYPLAACRPKANTTGVEGGIGGGGGVSYPYAPLTITFDGELTDPTPDFDVAAALGSVLLGDTLRFQQATDSGFTTNLTTVDTVITQPMIDNITVTFAGFTIATDGTYYWRARMLRSAVAITDWSNTQSGAMDVPPTITTASTANNAENSTLAISLTANQTVTWSIVAGGDGAKFEISGTTLRWASNGTKDYEIPDDADTNNTYVVTVRATATSDSQTTDKTITVTVTNDVADDAWVPSDVSATIWFDASDLATMKQETTGASATTAAAVGSPVGSWLNKGSLGAWMVCGSNGARPILRQNGSLYYLEFDGIDDTFDIFVPALAATNFTVATAIRIVSKHSSYEGAVGCGSTWLGSRINSGAWGTYNGSDRAANTTLATGTDYVLSMDRGASGSGNFRQNATSDGTFSDTSGQSFTNIGGQSTGNQNINGYIYGVVGVASQLSAPNIAKLHTYLGAKAGLTL